MYGAKMLVALRHMSRMDTELHGALSLLQLKAQGVGCRVYEQWKLLCASFGSTVALMGSATSSTITGVSPPR